MDFRLKDSLRRLALKNIYLVSILVLMDFRLKEFPALTRTFAAPSFNPCSNGLSAQRTWA